MATKLIHVEVALDLCLTAILNTWNILLAAGVVPRFCILIVGVIL